MRPRARSNRPSLLDSMMTGICPEHLVVLDERTGLIAVETRHHDVHEDDVGLVVGDLGQRVEPVDSRKDLAAFLVSSGSAVRRIVLLVVDHQTFNPVSFGLPYVIVLSMKLPSGA